LAGRRRYESLTPEEVLARHSDGPNTGVFTDGSCEPNPGPGGWGWVWVNEGEIIGEGAGGHPDTTNNRMELTALIEAYRALPEDAKLTVYSDSQLCVNTINQWAAGWERRGWKRKGGEIKNLDLVKQLWAISRARPHVKLEWIKAHDGSRWNEYADALASTAPRR
jgi:ribonuclease HI